MTVQIYQLTDSRLGQKFLPVRIRGVSHHGEPLMHLSILISELLLELTKVGVGCSSDTGWAGCSRSLHEEGPKRNSK
jgi:hypothetical protein